MLLVFAFGCNLRAIFMKPNYKSPLETSEQIVKSKKVISSNSDQYTLICPGSAWKYFLTATYDPVVPMDLKKSLKSFFFIFKQN